MKFVNYLEEIDVVYEYKEYEGGHDWTVWFLQFVTFWFLLISKRNRFTVPLFC